MAISIKISQLPELISASDATILPVVDNGVTQQITFANLKSEIMNGSDIDDYITTSSFNSYTASQNTLNATWATTGSNTFIGNQNISGSIGINSNSGSWTFKKDGTLTLPNGAGIYGDGLLQVDAIGGFKLNSYTNEFGSGSQYWYFNSDGTLDVPGNIYGASNLATTGSNTFRGDQYVSGTIWMSGSIVPAADTSLTSSFSLGSSTNAWKDIWVSQGTIHFIGATGEIKDTLSATADGLAMTNLDIASNLVVTGSIITDSITGSLLSTNGVISSSQQIAGYGYAITGSNSFKQSQTISGSLTITQDLILLGSASIRYITSSQLNISDNIITVNTIQPSIRFGGMAVIDSGSNPQRSGSILFDSQEDQWIYVHQNSSTITSSLLIMGPETYNSVGNETHPTTNRVMKSINDEHIGDSNISDNGTTITMLINTNVTGSLKVTSAISASTFTGLGNLTTFSTSVDSRLDGLEIYSQSLKNEFTISNSQLFINTPKVNISGSSLALNSINNNNIYFLAANVSTSKSGGDEEGGGNTTTTRVTGSLVWDVANQYWKAGVYGSEVELADVNYVDTSINTLSSSVRTTIQTLSSSFNTRILAVDDNLVSTASFNALSSSFNTRIIAATNEQFLGGYLTTSSFNTISSSFNTRILAVDDNLVSTASFNALSSSFNTRIIAATNEQFLGAYLTTSSFNTISASFSTRIDAVDDRLVSTSSFNSFTSSYNTTSASFSTRINAISTSSFATTTALSVVSASAWGAFQSASTYSASLAIAIQAVNDNLATTSSNTFIGNEIITGSLVVTGSIASNVVVVTISSSTASLDLSKGNNFTLTLSGSNTRIVATNIKPGITANLLITTGTNTSASLGFLQPSGSAYTASLGSGKKDVISLTSFDTTNMYVTTTKNFI